MSLTRRRFIAAGTPTAAWCWAPARARPRNHSTPRVHVHAVRRIPIVAPRHRRPLGGLTAYKLQKAGLKAKIYEGADRTGGRMFTATNLLGEGVTTELGGEFIDSNHEEMLALMDEFKLERLDTRSPEAEKFKAETYFINGRHYTQAQAARAFVPLAKRILEDYDKLGDVVDYKRAAGRSSIAFAGALLRRSRLRWMRES